MTHEEQQHLDIIKEIIESGAESHGRNGLTKSLFVRTMRFGLSMDANGQHHKQRLLQSCDPNYDGSVIPGSSTSFNLPISTVAGTMTNGIVEEFKSFVLRGQSSSKYLEEQNVNIWKANTVDTDGIIGPAYGHNYRNYSGTYDASGQTRDGIDQVADVIKLLRDDPGSRRMIVLNYDPRSNDKCVLFPCQMMFQFYVDNNGVSVHAYNRSSDICCAGMWNTAFATLLCGYVSLMSGHIPHEVVVTFGNVHVYENQLALAAEHVKRKPTAAFPVVTMTMGDDSTVDITVDHVDKANYQPRIKYPMTA